MGPLKRLIIKNVIKNPDSLINYIVDSSSIIKDGTVKRIYYDGVYSNETFGLITDTNALIRFHVEQDVHGHEVKSKIDIYINPSDFTKRMAPCSRTLGRYIQYRMEWSRYLD